MKKIVILGDTDNPRYGLVSQLKKLFPECEIQIVQRQPEGVEVYLSAESKVLNLFGEKVT